MIDFLTMKFFWKCKWFAIYKFVFNLIFALNKHGDWPLDDKKTFMKVINEYAILINL